MKMIIIVFRVLFFVLYNNEIGIFVKYVKFNIRLINGWEGEWFDFIFVCGR